MRRSILLLSTCLLSCGLNTFGVDASSSTASDSSDITSGAPTTGETPTTSAAATTSATATTAPTSGESSSTSAATDAPLDTTTSAETMICVDHCDDESDCEQMGDNAGFVCENHRCVAPSQCDGDLACWTLYSGWNVVCSDQAGCPGQVCIDIGDGQGACATPPSDFLMCEVLMQHETLMPVIEGGASVTVCAATEYTCNAAAQCERPCRSNADCEATDGTPICNTRTGVCHCSSDEDCLNSGVPRYTACRDGACGCGDDADCAGSGDACEAGLCTCSSSDACTPTYDGTTPACEVP